MSKLYTYDIKFKRFIDGIWDGKFRTTKISAENEFQAVFQHGQTNGVAFPGQNVEDVIVMVDGGQATSFEVGCSYETLEGNRVKMVSISNAGSNYETLADENGHHRYARRDRGRCTGSKPNNPGNVQLGVFWLRYDMEDPYDYVMERKHKVYTEEELYTGEDQ